MRSAIIPTIGAIVGGALLTVGVVGNHDHLLGRPIALPIALVGAILAIAGMYVSFSGSGPRRQ